MAKFHLEWAKGRLYIYLRDRLLLIFSESWKASRYRCYQRVIRVPEYRELKTYIHRHITNCRLTFGGD